MCDIVVKPGGLCALCSKYVSSVSEIVSKYIAVYKVTLLDTLSRWYPHYAMKLMSVFYSKLQKIICRIDAFIL